MKIVAVFFITLSVVFSLLLFTAVNPPKAAAVPSYARQTGLACSGCHYTPPELNPAGRRFKLLGYVDRADETKVVKADGGKEARRARSSVHVATFGVARDLIHLDKVSGPRNAEWQHRTAPGHFSFYFWRMDIACRQLHAGHLRHPRRPLQHGQHRYPLRQEHEVGRQRIRLRSERQQQSDCRRPVEQHAGLGLSLGRR